MTDMRWFNNVRQCSWGLVCSINPTVFLNFYSYGTLEIGTVYSCPDSLLTSTLPHLKNWLGSF